VGVTAALIFARWYGLNYTGTLIPWSVKVGIEPFVALCFIKSYFLAPTFFQPWFLGTVLLALFGFLGSLIFFGETISIIKICGAVLSLIGAALLIL
jgi:hypothetical protein